MHGRRRLGPLNSPPMESKSAFQRPRPGLWPSQTFQTGLFQLDFPRKHLKFSDSGEYEVKIPPQGQLIPVLALSSTKSAPQKNPVRLPTGRSSPGCGYEDRLPGQGRLADRSLYPLPGEQKRQRQTVRRTDKPKAGCSENGKTKGRMFGEQGKAILQRRA